MRWGSRPSTSRRRPSIDAVGLAVEAAGLDTLDAGAGIDVLDAFMEWLDRRTHGATIRQA
jgi:hypothetical protein